MPDATKPMAANTRCPVSSSTIIEANIRSAVASFVTRAPPRAGSPSA